MFQSVRIFQFVVFHTFKGFSKVNKAEVDLFFWNPFAFFFYDETHVGNLISGYSAFSKSSLYIWRFLIHLLLKRNLKDFEHKPTRMGNELHGSLIILWHCLSL